MPPALPAEEKPPVRYSDRQGEKKELKCCLYHFNYQNQWSNAEGERTIQGGNLMNGKVPIRHSIPMCGSFVLTQEAAII